MVDHRRMEEIQKFQMKDISDTCGKCMYVCGKIAGEKYE